MKNSRKLTLAGWPPAILIVATLLITEYIPIVPGTGEDAIVDWGFWYVTIRFMLLPAACMIHIVTNIIGLLIIRHALTRAQVIPFSSIILTGSLLYYLYEFV